MKNKELLIVTQQAQAVNKVFLSTKKLIINAKDVSLIIYENDRGWIGDNALSVTSAIGSTQMEVIVDVKESVTTVSLESAISGTKPQVYVLIPKDAGLYIDDYNLSIRADDCNFSFFVGSGYKINTVNLHLTNCKQWSGDKACRGINIYGELRVKKSFVVHANNSDSIELAVPNIADKNIKLRKNGKKTMN